MINEWMWASHVVYVCTYSFIVKYSFHVNIKLTMGFLVNQKNPLRLNSSRALMTFDIYHISSTLSFNIPSNILHNPSNAALSNLNFASCKSISVQLILPHMRIPPSTPPNPYISADGRGGTICSLSNGLT